jgi:hypothetical protein
MATTYDISSTQSIKFMSGNRLYVAETVLDFSDRNMTSTETVKVATIPAKTLVLDVVYQVKTAEGAALTIDIGDGGSATRYGNDVNCNTTTHSHTALAAPYYYSAEGELDILCNTAGADAAVVVFKMVCIDMSDSKDSY